MFALRLVFVGLFVTTASMAAPPLGDPAPAQTESIAVDPEATEAPPVPEESASRAPTPAPVNAETFAQPEMFISNGDRVFLEDKGFSIMPPVGWEVHKNIPGISLLFQVPKKGVKYQRTIQVVWGQETYVMDDYTAQDFAKTLIERRSKAYGNNGYRLRNQLPITLEDGTKAFLYYTEFEYDTFPMMELHILISSATGHFLMTYTDLAKFFEEQGGNSMLDVAYNSMISAKLDSKPAGRFDFLYKAGVVLLAFMLLWTVMRFLQGRHSFDEYADDDSEIKTGKSEMMTTRGQDDGGDWGTQVSNEKAKKKPEKKPFPKLPKKKAASDDYDDEDFEKPSKKKVASAYDDDDDFSDAM
ncbi:MAG: hypothetical protein AB7T49_18870 [Oligoflexales bacterium]